jgi:hypothetical protein
VIGVFLLPFALLAFVAKLIHDGLLRIRLKANAIRRAETPEWRVALKWAQIAGLAFFVVACVMGILASAAFMAVLIPLALAALAWIGAVALWKRIKGD